MQSSAPRQHFITYEIDDNKPVTAKPFMENGKPTVFASGIADNLFMQCSTREEKVSLVKKIEAGEMWYEMVNVNITHSQPLLNISKEQSDAIKAECNEILVSLGIKKSRLYQLLKAIVTLIGISLPLMIVAFFIAPVAGQVSSRQYRKGKHDNDMEPHAENNNGMSPFADHYAQTQNRLHPHLNLAKSNLNLAETTRSATNKQFFQLTPEQQENYVRDALMTNDAVRFEIAVAYGYDIFSKNSQGESLLTIAIAYSALRTVENLLKHGLDPNEGSLEKIQYTVNHEFLPKIAASNPMEKLILVAGKIPIEAAVERGETALLDLLMKYQIKRNDPVISSGALLAAFKSNRIDLAYYLVKRGFATEDFERKQKFYFRNDYSQYEKAIQSFFKTLQQYEIAKKDFEKSDKYFKSKNGNNCDLLNLYDELEIPEFCKFHKGIKELLVNAVSNYPIAKKAVRTYEIIAEKHNASLSGFQPVALREIETSERFGDILHVLKKSGGFLNNLLEQDTQPPKNPEVFRLLLTLVRSHDMLGNMEEIYKIAKMLAEIRLVYPLADEDDYSPDDLYGIALAYYYKYLIITNKMGKLHNTPLANALYDTTISDMRKVISMLGENSKKYRYAEKLESIEQEKSIKEISNLLHIREQSLSIPMNKQLKNFIEKEWLENKNAMDLSGYAPDFLLAYGFSLLMNGEQLKSFLNPYLLEKNKQLSDQFSHDVICRVKLADKKLYIGFLTSNFIENKLEQAYPDFDLPYTKKPGSHESVLGLISPHNQLIVSRLDYRIIHSMNLRLPSEEKMKDYTNNHHHYLLLKKEIQIQIGKKWLNASEMNFADYFILCSDGEEMDILTATEKNGQLFIYPLPLSENDYHHIKSEINQNIEEFCKGSIHKLFVPDDPDWKKDKKDEEDYSILSKILPYFDLDIENPKHKLLFIVVLAFLIKFSDIMMMKLSRYLKSNKNENSIAKTLTPQQIPVKKKIVKQQDYINEDPVKPQLSSTELLACEIQEQLKIINKMIGECEKEKNLFRLFSGLMR